MPDAELLEALRRGLAERFEVGEEIGHGGMAVVFLATDLRLGRRVAIKVMKPELSSAVGPARFLREIALLAKLVHPHVISLYESGEVQGMPYFVMPFVPGESLDRRLQREKQLPLDEVVDLTRQVALAIDYAHGQGVIHRDIKPQNILISSGQALVADFGIATALVTAGGESLTTTGMAVGSPLYMSPEQAAGTREVDHRSDIYSLGCVVYELLVGEPPFGGRTPHAVIARHQIEPIPDLRTVRNAIPLRMERAVKKALAKLPADRYRTATEFAVALQQSLQPGITQLSVPDRVRGMRLTGVALVAAAFVLLVAVAIALTRTGAGSSPSGSGTLAVLPFQVSGGGDSVALTPVGAAEEISSRLGGAGVLQAVDPVLIRQAWQRKAGTDNRLSGRDALRLARSLGADVALVGNIEGSASRIVIGGSLQSTGTGATLDRVEDIAGPRDSLVPLLDRFVMSLLLHRVGEGWRRPAEIGTGSLDAVKAYATGLSAYRRGRYEAAAGEFERALRADSDFALARLRLGLAHWTALNVEPAARVFDEVWRRRDRLPRGDSILLMALIGARYPSATPIAQQLSGPPAGAHSRFETPVSWEFVADSLPHQWEGAYELGDYLLTYGQMLGRESPRQRARVALLESLRGDSAFAPALVPLIDLAAIAGDTGEVHRLGSLYLAANPLADHADYVRWRVAVALGDSATRAALRGRFEQTTRVVLERISGVAQLDAVALDDAVAAAAELRRRARNDYDLWWTGMIARELALNRGRREDVPPTPEFTRGSTMQRVVEALYWSGDSAEAGRIVAAHAREADAIPPRNADGFYPGYTFLCAASLWRLAHAQAAGIDRAIARLRAVPGADRSAATTFAPLCAATLDARLAAQTHSPRARTALDALDSIMRPEPSTNPYIRLAARRALVDLWEAAGEPRRALAAARQRMYHHLAYGVAGLSDMLLREARLAAMTGDTTGAIHAYEHFLTLRANAQPPWDLHAAGVRRELAALRSPRSP